MPVYRDAKSTVLASATNCSAVNVYFSAALQTVKHTSDQLSSFMRELSAEVLVLRRDGGVLMLLLYGNGAAAAPLHGGAILSP